MSVKVSVCAVTHLFVYGDCAPCHVDFETSDEVAGKKVHFNCLFTTCD